MFDFNGKRVGCLMSCNEKPQYIKWVPYAVAGWNALGIRPIIVLINLTEIPDTIKDLDCDIILHNKNNHLTTSYVAQVIRNLYPGLMKDYDAIIISDIDMVPLPNRLYFENYINESIEKQCFIGMRWKTNQCFMPWNVAPPKIWNEMFPCENEDDVAKILDEWYTAVNGHNDKEQFIRGGSAYLYDQYHLTRAALKRPDTIILNIPLYQLHYSWWETEDPGLYELGAFDCNRQHRRKIDIEQDYDPINHIAYNSAGAGEVDTPAMSYILKNILHVQV